MTRCLEGLAVVLGAAPANMYTPGHGMNMGPGGKNLFQDYGPDMFDKANFWEGWGGDTEIDELMLGVDFDLATWQQQGATTRNWEVQTEQIRGESIGAFDISYWKKQMESLKAVPVGVAQALLARGQQAINYAILTAKAVDTAHSISFGPAAALVQKFPRAARREEVQGKLRWHTENLAKVSPSVWAIYSGYTNGDKEAFKKAAAQISSIYGSGEDLKKWVMEAFIEANAAEEGGAAIAKAWEAMWTEIAAALAALPKLIADQAGKVITSVAWYLKWTYWLAIAGGVLALGLLGLGTGLSFKGRFSTTK